MWICFKGFNQSGNQDEYKNWYIGRAPPTQFEYDRINGYYSPDQAKEICENDIQCGGFTFKGTRQNVERKNVYFFHYIDFDDPQNLKYPHWTIYVPNRKYSAIMGNYKSIPFQVVKNYDTR